MTSTAAIHAAQEAAKAKQEEEEFMTTYRNTDLTEEWEFKIVRSATSAFKKPAVLQQVIEQETLAGWTLLEKFDDNRLRFKRPASMRKKDAMLPRDVDPYRTQFGISEAALGGWVALVVMLGVGIFVGVMIILSTRGVI